MITKRLRQILLGAAVVSASMLGAVESSAQPSPSECVQQSVANCRYWDELGYSSIGECRLAEYDKCMAGEPPYGGLDLARWGRTTELRV